MISPETVLPSELPAWKELLLRVPDVDAKWREPLARHTTFRVGGPVTCLARPRTEEAFIDLIRNARKEGVPFLVLGGGSNVLAPDGAWDMLVVQPRRACASIREVDESGLSLYVGSGVRLAEWLRFCVRYGLSGVECLVGIPGAVGGALAMNAGATGGCIADSLVWIEVLDEEGGRLRIDRSELSISYRSLGLPREWVVLGGCFRLHAASTEELKIRLREGAKRRWDAQPLGLPSAGCIFKNPPGESAGALIDKSGLKGLRIGDAQISEKHANWIINLGKARAGEILSLMELVEERVFDRFGVRLEREVRVLGGEET